MGEECDTAPSSSIDWYLPELEGSFDAADTIRLLNLMLSDWRGRAVIDPAKIGFIGFSAGAYTGLVFAGGNPDFRKSRRTVLNRENGWPVSSFVAATFRPIHLTSRIRAAVLADTASNFMFSPVGLAGIQIPLLIWRSELGGGGVDPKNSPLIASSLPAKPEIRVVPAGHFALPPCTLQLRGQLAAFLYRSAGLRPNGVSP